VNGLVNVPYSCVEKNEARKGKEGEKLNVVGEKLQRLVSARCSRRVEGMTNTHVTYASQNPFSIRLPPEFSKLSKPRVHNLVIRSFGRSHVCDMEGE